MRIFKFEKGEILINRDEIFLYAPFYKIYQRDKTADKAVAFAEFKYIYFVADTDAVPYKQGYDTSAAVDYAIANANLPPHWIPDDVVNEAVEIYKEENMNVVSNTVREILLIFGNYAKILRKLRKSLDVMMQKDTLDRDELKEVLSLLDGTANIASGIPDIKGKLYKVLKEIELIHDKDTQLMRGLGESVPISADPTRDY